LFLVSGCWQFVTSDSKPATSDLAPVAFQAAKVRGGRQCANLQTWKFQNGEKYLLAGLLSPISSTLHLSPFFHFAIKCSLFSKKNPGFCPMQLPSLVINKIILRK
jgi:hypothetical protein